MAPTPEKFVEASLKTVGIESYTTGYPPHFLLTAVICGLRCVCEKGALWLITKTMCNIRARALNKKAKRPKDNLMDTLQNEDIDAE